MWINLIPPRTSLGRKGVQMSVGQRSKTIISQTMSLRPLGIIPSHATYLPCRASKPGMTEMAFFFATYTWTSHRTFWYYMMIAYESTRSFSWCPKTLCINTYPDKCVLPLRFALESLCPLSLMYVCWPKLYSIKERLFCFGMKIQFQSFIYKFLMKYIVKY